MKFCCENKIDIDFDFLTQEEVSGVECDDAKEKYALMKEMYKEKCEGNILFVLALDALEDGPKRMNYSKWTGGYYEDKFLTKIYDLLERLGMEISQEERELLDGTSELYKSNDKNSI